MPSKQAVDYCADYLTQVVQYVSQVTLPRQYGKQFLQNQQISYVITVPAIWSDKAKELTRQVIPLRAEWYVLVYLWFLVDIFFREWGSRRVIVLVSIRSSYATSHLRTSHSTFSFHVSIVPSIFYFRFTPFRNAVLISGGLSRRNFPQKTHVDHGT